MTTLAKWIIYALIALVLGWMGLRLLAGLWPWLVAALLLYVLVKALHKINAS